MNFAVKLKWWKEILLFVIIVLIVIELLDLSHWILLVNSPKDFRGSG